MGKISGEGRAGCTMGDKGKYQTMATPRALLKHLPLDGDEDGDGEEDDDDGVGKYVVVVTIPSRE